MNKDKTDKIDKAEKVSFEKLEGINVGIVRQKCALLPLRALHKSLDDWK